MTTTPKTEISNLNSTISNLLSNGFEEYLNVFEPFTVDGDINMQHIIMCCTKGFYSGWVVDIYHNKKGLGWLIYSKQ
jgi:hypothetical protein